MRKRGKKEGVQGDLNIERVQFFLSTASVMEGLKKWSTPKGVYLDASEFLDMVCVLGLWSPCPDSSSISSSTFYIFQKFKFSDCASSKVSGGGA